MKTVSELKTLGDMRTSISAHTRSAPRHKGSTYLDILSLGMEKLRLETELGSLNRRRGRLELRLREVQEILGQRLLEMQGQLPEAAPPPTSPNGQDHPPRDMEANGECWRSMTIEY